VAALTHCAERKSFRGVLAAEEFQCGSRHAPCPCTIPLSSPCHLKVALIKTSHGPKCHRARSVPPPQTQCFCCLATDHLVAACREPVRYHSCLLYGHRSLTCSMAGSYDLYPRWVVAWGARRSASREGPRRHHATPCCRQQRVGSGAPPAPPTHSTVLPFPSSSGRGRWLSFHSLRPLTCSHRPCKRSGTPSLALRHPYPPPPCYCLTG
jgi:hypothetical protein